MRSVKAAVLAATMIGTFSIAQVPASAAPVGIQASYGGTTIDLGKGWKDAQVCAEFAVGDVRCFRTPQDFAATSGEFGIAAAEDCKYTWVCLWENIDHTGRRLQWNASGTKKLADWGFRDQASSAALHRPQSGATLVNYVTALPDQHAYLAANGIYSDFRSFGWNDKADEIQVG
ncbi:MULTISPECIES: peptidase inhibitor family I36 protein [unclassified Amycolatopsis]|uniref:peptidase inhibitor family I36 protein n=1 Tax=unclassified Amycolatopsis TaxID=2618356 RepID=UPI002875E5FE|nr:MULTISPECIES: peptidase inhibitor family I36 protein [unclassified Amycolatopsis]MDS0136075.1 peptidase inhibitor family I36 protein [Amycolatopsis sp. 505]MDS0145336.1 peptidase inhibitor family I36 protein [Amycolatopsis sp. CM201R]